MCDLCVDAEVFAVDSDLVDAAGDDPSECAFGLVADEDDRGVVAGDVVFKVVLDASAGAHTGRRHDDVGAAE